MPTPNTRRGIIAMTVTVIAWAGFALSIRSISGSSMLSGDVALLRFGIPILVLMFALPRFFRTLRRERPLVLLALFLGAGLPYFLVSALAGALTSAALVGLVIPGSVPLFVVVIGALLLRERYRLRRLVPITVLGAGIGIVAVGVAYGTGTDGSPLGMALLVGAGSIWAVYTIALRFTSLDATCAAIAVCLPSLCLTIFGLLTGMLPSALLNGRAEIRDIVFFAIVQGLGVGVVAGIAYAIAIRNIGPDRAATIGALSPVVVAAFGTLVLGESLPLTTVVGGLTVVAGIVAFNIRRKPVHISAKFSSPVSEERTVDGTGDLDLTRA